jgi:type IV pilus assembly protein PilB
MTESTNDDRRAELSGLEGSFLDGDELIELTAKNSRSDADAGASQSGNDLLDALEGVGSSVSRNNEGNEQMSQPDFFTPSQQGPIADLRSFGGDDEDNTYNGIPGNALAKRRSADLQGTVNPALTAFVDIEPESVPLEALVTLPLDQCRAWGAIVFSRIGNTIEVAMADPSDLVALDNLRLSLNGYDATVWSADPARVDATIAAWKRKVNERTQSETAREIAGEISVDQRSVEANDDGRMAQLVNQVLEEAVLEGASDIHIEPGNDELVFRFRVDGVLREVHRYPVGITPGVVNRIKVLGQMDIGERRLPQDGRFQRQLSGRVIDCRVVTIPTSWGSEGAVLRIFDQSRGLQQLSSLGFHPHIIEPFTEALSAPHGLIIVTGPTGSGKTTTLYSSLGVVAREDRKTLSVEDPVEVRIPGVSQVQVNEKAGLTFASALRSFLRADPDVMLVGEIRDGETAALAAQAALTGHLVLSTLHTNEAAGAPTRLADLGLAGYVVASALRAVLAQRLLRRLCPSCRMPVMVDHAAIERRGGWPLGIEAPEQLWVANPAGCRNCNKTGFKGRLVSGELLVVTDAVAQAITNQVSSGELERIAREEGAVPLSSDSLLFLASGETSLDEIIRAGV